MSLCRHFWNETGDHTVCQNLIILFNCSLFLGRKILMIIKSVSKSFGCYYVLVFFWGERITLNIKPIMRREGLLKVISIFFNLQQHFQFSSTKIMLWTKKSLNCLSWTPPESVKIFLLSQNLMRQTNVSHKILWTRNNEKFSLT